jgi:hypothetical protein
MLPYCQATFCAYLVDASRQSQLLVHSLRLPKIECMCLVHQLLEQSCSSTALPGVACCCCCCPGELSSRDGSATVADLRQRAASQLRNAVSPASAPAIMAIARQLGHQQLQVTHLLLMPAAERYLPQAAIFTICTGHSLTTACCTAIA